MSSRRHFLKQSAPLLAGLTAAQQMFTAQLQALALPRHTADTFTALRAQYMLAPEVTYLNHASIGTMPRPVHEALQRYLTVCEANPWLHMWGPAWQAPREAVRATAAQFMGCAPEAVAVLHNTTEAFNILAQGLPLGPGDEVVFSTLNHTGASAAFTHAADVRGFTVRRFDFPTLEAPHLTEADVLDLYDRHLTPQTKLLVLPHIDNTVGLRHPLSALAQLARDRGVDFIAVDAAQTVGMIPVNLAELDVDVFATSPHKWVQSPKGLGLTYFSPAVQAVLRPMWVTWGQDRWADSARKYEDYGTRNLAELLALGDALTFQMQIDAEARETRLRALWTYTRRAVDAHPRLTWRSPTDWALGGSLYAIEIAGWESPKLFEYLFGEHGFVFRPFVIDGVHTARLSPNVFTSEAEISRFFDLATA